MVVPDRVGQVQVFPAVWLNKSHRRLSKGASVSRKNGDAFT